MTPGNVIAIGTGVAVGVWLVREAVGGAAWLYGRALTALEERHIRRIQAIQAQLERDADEYAAYVQALRERGRLARAREDLQRFDEEEDDELEQLSRTLHELRFFNLEDWAAPSCRETDDAE